MLCTLLQYQLQHIRPTFIERGILSPKEMKGVKIVYEKDQALKPAARDPVTIHYERDRRIWREDPRGGLNLLPDTYDANPTFIQSSRFERARVELGVRCPC